MAIRTSIGTPTANSYISVASANTYFETIHVNNGWTDLDTNTNATAATTKKENLLIQATRDIDNLRYMGSKYNQGLFGDDDFQRLEFPRTNNILSDTSLYIPEEIQQATCEQALWILERTGKRTNDDGALIDRQMIGKDAMFHLKYFINRQVQPTGRYGWQGSDW